MHPILCTRKAGLWGDQEPDSQDTSSLPLTPQHALDQRVKHLLVSTALFMSFVRDLP